MTATLTAASASVIATSILLIVLAIQYPLSTTFPMGGDATRYIRRAQEVSTAWQTAPRNGIKTLLTNTWYPGITALVVTSKALPMDWPHRFNTLAALCQVAVGASVGWFLYKVFDWRYAATGIAFWAVTPVAAIRDFDDGTIAQLLSYSFIFLALERFHAAKPAAVLGLLLSSFVIHPLTGAVLTCIMAITLLTLAMMRKQLPEHINKAVVVAGIMLLALITVGSAIGISQGYSYVLTVNYIIPEPLTHFRIPFMPLLLLVPFGLVKLLRQHQTAPHTFVAILSLVALSAALSINDKLGINVLVLRFKPYFAIAVVILASIGFPYMLRILFKNKHVRTVAAVIFIAGLGTAVGYYNAGTYAAYEDPIQYRRIHPDEVAAILWLKENIQHPATVFSTRVNRHSEWLPILSHHNWIFFKPGEENSILTEDIGRDRYLMYFLKREVVPKDIEQEATRFPVVFKNDGAVIMQIP